MPDTGSPRSSLRVDERDLALPTVGDLDDAPLLREVAAMEAALAAEQRAARDRSRAMWARLDALQGEHEATRRQELAQVDRLEADILRLLASPNPTQLAMDEATALAEEYDTAATDSGRQSSLLQVLRAELSALHRGGSDGEGASECGSDWAGEG
eukprot:EG_transcript_37631